MKTINFIKDPVLFNESDKVIIRNLKDQKALNKKLSQQVEFKGDIEINDVCYISNVTDKLMDRISKQKQGFFNNLYHHLLSNSVNHDNVEVIVGGYDNLTDKVKHILQILAQYDLHMIVSRDISPESHPKLTLLNNTDSIQGRCACMQHIKNHFVFKNKYNGKVLWLGSDCVNYYMDDDSKTILKGVLRKTLFKCENCKYQYLNHKLCECHYIQCGECDDYINGTCYRCDMCKLCKDTIFNCDCPKCYICDKAYVKKFHFSTVCSDCYSKHCIPCMGCGNFFLPLNKKTKQLFNAYKCYKCYKK